MGALRQRGQSMWGPEEGAWASPRPLAVPWLPWKAKQARRGSWHELTPEDSGK